VFSGMSLIDEVTFDKAVLKAAAWTLLDGPLRA
jgi:hypothetical protein